MNKFLLSEAEKHPLMQPQDVVKFLYQSFYGPEHIIVDDDMDHVHEFYSDEYDSASVNDEALLTILSEDYSRVNFWPFKGLSLDREYLFRMFVNSAEKQENKDTDLISALKDICSDLSLYGFSFSHEEYIDYISSYIDNGIKPVHHSSVYSSAYHPQYRLIKNRYIPVIKLLSSIRINNSDKPFIIAVDGRCGSGKSTLAADLETIAGFSVIHMDDFYVPMHLRTKERYETPGNNVHHERIIRDIIPKLKDTDDFAYRLFDHRTLEIGEEIRTVRGSERYIVEGAYSLNPVLGKYYDFSVFYDIDPELQIQRIEKRNPDKIDDFRNRWIPLEEEYIRYYGIDSDADIVLKANDFDIDL